MVLTIQRSGTLYSLSQMVDQSTSPTKGVVATPELAVKEVAGSLLPIFKYPAADTFASKRIRSFGDLNSALVPDIDDRNRSSDDESFGDASSDSFTAQLVPQRSVLDTLLLAEWEDRVEQDLFRYDVTACATRPLPGPYGFVAQLNEGRASKKRPTEFRVDLVNQPFDGEKFHFGKALQKEVLFQFEPASRREGRSFAPASPASASPTLVLINVSPIEYGHVLLVPRALSFLNQLVVPETLLPALHFSREAGNPYFRVGFNSLGAYGTINHLHFQAYYLAAPFAIERAPTVPLPPGLAPPNGAAFGRRGGRRRPGVSIEQLAEYPVRGLVFEAGDSLEELAELVGTACQALSSANVPHNLLIADCGARVFLWPNFFSERKAKGEIPEGASCVFKFNAVTLSFVAFQLRKLNG
jgi:GDP-L-galactose phosphorylase